MKHDSALRILREWSGFVDAETHVLRHYPELLLQQAANQPKQSAVRRHFESQITADPNLNSKRPWLQWLNRPEVSACISTITGHEKEIKQLVITTDGERLLSTSMDNSLRCWSLDGGRELFMINDFKGQIKAVSPHLEWITRPDWMITVDGEADGHQIWNSENGNLIAESPERIDELIFSNDGSLAAWSTFDSAAEWYMELPTTPYQPGWHYPEVVKIRDWDSGRRYATLLGKGPLTFSPDDRFLVFGRKVYDLKKERQAYSIHGGAHVAISDSTRRLVSANPECTVFVYDLDSGELICVLEGHTHWIAGVAVTPDGQRIVTAGKHGDVKVWDAVETSETEFVEAFEGDEIIKLKTGKLLREIQSHEGTVNRLIVLDNRRVMTAAISDRDDMQVGGDFSIKIWDIETGEMLSAVAAHGDKITAFACTPDGSRIVTGDERGVIRIWDVRTLETLKHEKTSLGWIWSLRITDDCAYVVEPNYNGSSRAWETLTGRETQVDESQPLVDRDAAVTMLDGSLKLAWADRDSKLKITKSENDEVIARFLFPETISCVAAKGPFVAVGGNGLGNVYLLELQGVNIEPRFAVLRKQGDSFNHMCPHCLKRVVSLVPDVNEIECLHCGRKVQLIDYPV